MATLAVKKTNSEYTEYLAQFQEIPTLPAVPMRVNELINDPYSSSADIAAVLKKDQVLTAKVLRLVNSTYYSIPGGVTDVQRALAYLGFNTIAQLVLGISVFTLFKDLKSEDFLMSDFWRHALGTAVCSEVIAKRIKYPKPEEAFTCGLLHDIGKLVMYLVDPVRFTAIVKKTREKSLSFVEVEKDYDLPGHAFLGEQVAAKWGLPQVIRLAIHYHHHDVSKKDSVLASAKPAIQIVRLANTICIKNQFGRSGDCSTGTITSEMLESLGLSLSDLKQIETLLEKEIEKAGAFLNAYR